MANVQEIQAKLREKYALETDLQHWELWQKQLTAKLPELKAEKRQTEVARTEYEHSSLKRFFDKLSGRREEKLEALQLAERNAANALAQVERELQDLQRQMAIAREELETFGAFEEEFSQFIEQEPQLKEQLQRLKALLCAKAMIPILEGNRKALENAREWARADVRVERISVDYMKNMCYSEADSLAKKCREYLERISECGILLEIHPYFLNPAGYIVGVSEHAQLDRLNYAMKAIGETEAQARELILQLTDE